MIYPLHSSALKDVDEQLLTPSIKVLPYKVETGDIKYDLKKRIDQIKEAASQTIAEIDRIRSIDVPWKTYLGVFVFFFAIVIVIAFISNKYVRMDPGFLVGILAGFVVVQLMLVLVFIYCEFREEEVRDCKKLVDLFNKKRAEAKADSSARRMMHKVHNFDIGRSKDAVEQNFLNQFNLMRLNSLHFIVETTLIKQTDASITDHFN